MFANSGEITDPCGVPTVVLDHCPSSDTPAVSISHQPEYHAIGYTMFQKFHHPVMVSLLVIETAYVRVENPVYLSAFESLHRLHLMHHALVLMDDSHSCTLGSHFVNLLRTVRTAAWTILSFYRCYAKWSLLCRRFWRCKLVLLGWAL